MGKKLVMALLIAGTAVAIAGLSTYAIARLSLPRTPVAVTRQVSAPSASSVSGSLSWTVFAPRFESAMRAKGINVTINPTRISRAQDGYVYSLKSEDGNKFLYIDINLTSRPYRVTGFNLGYSQDAAYADFAKNCLASLFAGLENVPLQNADSAIDDILSAPLGNEMVGPGIFSYQRQESTAANGLPANAVTATITGSS